MGDADACNSLVVAVIYHFALFGFYILIGLFEKEKVIDKLLLCIGVE